MRYFVRDAYGPPVTPFPPQQTWGERSNNTGANQSRQRPVVPERSVGPTAWKTVQNADLPTTPTPENAEIAPSTFAQPSLPKPVQVREVAARYPFDSGRYSYWTCSSHDGSGHYATWRSDARDPTAGQQLVAVHSGDFWFVGDPLAEPNDYVVYKAARIPTDLGKLSNWSTDAAAAQCRRNLQAPSVLARINTANRCYYA